MNATECHDEVDPKEFVMAGPADYFPHPVHRLTKPQVRAWFLENYGRAPKHIYQDKHGRMRGYVVWPRLSSPRASDLLDEITKALNAWLRQTVEDGERIRLLVSYHRADDEPGLPGYNKNRIEFSFARDDEDMLRQAKDYQKFGWPWRPYERAKEQRMSDCKRFLAKWVPDYTQAELDSVTAELERIYARPPDSKNWQAGLGKIDPWDVVLAVIKLGFHGRIANLEIRTRRRRGKWVAESRENPGYWLGDLDPDYVRAVQNAWSAA